MIALIIVFSIGSIATFVYFQVDQYIESNRVDRAIDTARILAWETGQAVSEKDDELVNQHLVEFGSNPSIETAAIYLNNGSLLGFYNKDKSGPIPDSYENRPLIRTDTQLKIVEPVSYQGSEIGFVYLVHELDLLFDQEKYHYLFFTVIFVLSTVLAFAIASFFQQLVTRPIRRMVRHINQIYNSKNFEQRLEPAGDGELGRLTNEFNQILQAVQERENELTVHGRQLQRLVEVRTEQLYQKAHFDSLTGLPNRYLLVDRLHQAISKSGRSNANLALLFLDLDRFKVINDNLGHQNGDLLLKEVAMRLSKLAREGDTVARLGGDEFVFLLENLKSPEDAAVTARRIIDSFKTPFRLQEHILHVSTSIGISIFPDDGYDDKVLLKNADISMYHAKERGPGHFSFYSEDMNNTSLERLAIESNLRTAIKKNEFYILYQPQMRLKDNQYKNVEALLRWKNDEIDEISPSVFVPIAEETGLINQIDLWVISQVCKQLGKWREVGLTDITVAVNVSAGHLISDTLLEHLQREILLNKISASQIEIEITEAVFVEHTERTIQSLLAIKKLGSKIAIDDFGTGYSSLQYIQDFPADTLKLDGMFIRNLANNESSQGIVRSTILLAHSLGLEIVSECVEDQFQLDFLQQHKCDLVQGFLLSKPLEPDAVVVLCGH